MRRRYWAALPVLALGVSLALPATAQENPIAQPPLTNLDLTIAEAAALRDRIAQCWLAPEGIHALVDPVVVIHASMNPDGTLADTQLVDDEGRLGDPLYLSLVQAARRALFRCQPLPLPAEKYEDWREITFRFDAATLS